jgi:hypothetical protein
MTEAAAPPPDDELARLADALLEEARAVREQWTELGATLDRLQAAAAGARAVSTQGDEADPARLMALELARAGHNRQQVEEYLHRAFGLEADASVLDSVFSDQQQP